MLDDRRDPLTGLWTGRRLMQMLDQVAHDHVTGGRTPRWRSVLLVDVDDMRGLNNAWGYQVGDSVLGAVAAAVSTCTGDRAVAFRYGGKRFPVLSPDEVDECAEPALGLIDELRGGVLVENEQVAGARIPVSVSIGAALLEPAAAHDSLLRAEDALDAAKRAGGGLFRTWSAPD